jgi:hypothetical protein
MDAETCWRCGASMEWRHGTWQCGLCKLKLGCCEGEAQTSCEPQDESVSTSAIQRSASRTSTGFVSSV